MKVVVGVSNRHIHLTREDTDILFGKDYEFQKRNDLVQPGQFACEEVVKVSTDKYEFPYVRVLGPIRDYTQVEVLKKDAKLLGINPPERDSGDLEESESVFLEGPNGKIYKKNCCIIATKHIHCIKAEDLGHNKNDILKIKVNNKIIDNIHIKESPNFVNEFHIDKDDAEEYGLSTGDYINIE